MAEETIFEGEKAAAAQAAAIETLEKRAGANASDLLNNVVLEPAAFIENARVAVANQGSENKSED